MTPQQQQTIIRFGSRIPPHLTEHWNEVVEIINKAAADKYIEILETQTELYDKSIQDTNQGLNFLIKCITNRALNNRKLIITYIETIQDRLKVDKLQIL